VVSKQDNLIESAGGAAWREPVGSCRCNDCTSSRSYRLAAHAGEPAPDDGTKLRRALLGLSTCYAW
jgi:hypothetical protein